MDGVIIILNFDPTHHRASSSLSGESIGSRTKSFFVSYLVFDFSFFQIN